METIFKAELVSKKTQHPEGDKTVIVFVKDKYQKDAAIKAVEELKFWDTENWDKYKNPKMAKAEPADLEDYLLEKETAGQKGIEGGLYEATEKAAAEAHTFNPSNDVPYITVDITGNNDYYQVALKTEGDHFKSSFQCGSGSNLQGGNIRKFFDKEFEKPENAITWAVGHVVTWMMNKGHDKSIKTLDFAENSPIQWFKNNHEYNGGYLIIQEVKESNLNKILKALRSHPNFAHCQSPFPEDAGKFENAVAANFGTTCGDSELDADSIIEHINAMQEIRDLIKPECVEEIVAQYKKAPKAEFDKTGKIAEMLNKGSQEEKTEVKVLDFNGKELTANTRYEQVFLDLLLTHDLSGDISQEMLWEGGEKLEQAINEHKKDLPDFDEEGTIANIYETDYDKLIPTFLNIRIIRAVVQDNFELKNKEENQKSGAHALMSLLGENPHKSNELIENINEILPRYSDDVDFHTVCDTLIKAAESGKLTSYSKINNAENLNIAYFAWVDLELINNKADKNEPKTAQNEQKQDTFEQKEAQNEPKQPETAQKQPEDAPVDQFLGDELTTDFDVPCDSAVDLEISALNEELAELQPGQLLIKDNVSNNAYHAVMGDSSTKLKDSLVSLMYYNKKHNTGEIKRPTGVHFGIGNLTHTLALEPHKVNSEYKLKPDMKEATEQQLFKYNQWAKDGKPENQKLKPTDAVIKKIEEWKAAGMPDKGKPTTKQIQDYQAWEEAGKPEPYSGKPTDKAIERVEFWRKFEEESENLTIINEQDWELSENMAAALRTDPDSKPIICHPQASFERSYFKLDEDTGRLIKCRTDIDLGNIVGDVKTIALRGNPDEEWLLAELKREITKRKYDFSAAMYLDITGKKQFVWFFVNKEPGYHWVAAVKASAETLAKGFKAYRAQLEKIGAAEKSGVWPKPVSIQKALNPENDRLELPTI